MVLTGESGVGKEVVAALIHRLSPRRQAPVVNINCAGLPDSLLGSELFGHVRGSFTDAYRDRPGLLELANGGTVFLDEIGEMSMQMQAVLLRFLETGEIQRIGAHRTETRVDVRVICATNKSLIDQIKAKKFREDLYYRLNVIHLVIPPLRARREDIPLFLTHFLTSFTKRHRMDRVPELADDALEALVAYAWPGNVRELKNIVERLIVRNQSEKIELASLPGEIVHGSPMQARAAGPLEPTTSDKLFDRMVKEGESFWSAVPDLHVEGSHSRRSAADRQARARADAGQLQAPGAALQHEGHGLEAVPQVSTRVRLPYAVPAVPYAVDLGEGWAGGACRGRSGEGRRHHPVTKRWSKEWYCRPVIAYLSTRR